MGLQSLPVAFGVDTAKWITVGTIDITQFAVAAYLYFGLNEPLYAGILTALILPQVPMPAHPALFAHAAIVERRVAALQTGSLSPIASGCS